MGWTLVTVVWTIIYLGLAVLVGRFLKRKINWILSYYFVMPHKLTRCTCPTCSKYFDPLEAGVRFTGLMSSEMVCPYCGATLKSSKRFVYVQSILFILCIVLSLAVFWMFRDIDWKAITISLFPVWLFIIFVVFRSKQFVDIGKTPGSTNGRYDMAKSDTSAGEIPEWVHATHNFLEKSDARSEIIVGVVVVPILAGLMLYSLQKYLDQTIIIVVSGIVIAGLVVYVFQHWDGTRSEITTSQEEICKKTGEDSTCLDWTRIHSVDESMFRASILLATKDKKIRISYLTEGIDTIRQVIQYKCPVSCFPDRTIFRRWPVVFAPVFLCALCMTSIAAVAMIRKQSFDSTFLSEGIFLITLGVALIILVSLRIRSVTLLPDRLLLSRYLWWSSNVRYRDIQDFYIEDRVCSLFGSNNNALERYLPGPALRIEKKNGETVVITNIVNGPTPLYMALRRRIIGNQSAL